MLLQKATKKMSSVELSGCELAKLSKIMPSKVSENQFYENKRKKSIDVKFHTKLEEKEKRN